MKKDIKAQELVIEPKRAFHEKQEPLRFLLKNTKIVNMDSKLKRVYRINN